MRLFVLLTFALLSCLWSSVACVRIMPRNPPYSQDSTTNTHTKELGGDVLARFGFELQFKSLMAFNFEEYSDMEAPPGLSEASHGPIVFFRPKRRKHILTPPGFHPHTQPQAQP